MNNSSKEMNPRKKRKENDGRFTTDGAHDVNTGSNNDDDGSFPSPKNKTQLDRMEEMMMRMEEKLATVSSLERRCEQLERKCSSLENMLELTSQTTKKHIDKKFDSLYLHLEQRNITLENKLETKVDTVNLKVERSLKLHELNKMLIKNQSWEFTADDSAFGFYDEDEVQYLVETAEELKDLTTKMRQGEFPTIDPSVFGGICIERDNLDPPFSHEVNNELLPHWKEFAAALKQFTPAINLLPDNCLSCFTFDSVPLNHDAMLLVKEALIGMPFQCLAFTHNNNGDGIFGALGGMSVDAILDIVESNKHLQKLEIFGNQIGSHHIERLCSAVRNRHLVKLDLSESFEPGIGDEMLTSLLSIDDLKLKELVMSENNITSAVSNLLADFLATNSTLEILNLYGNNLNDSDAELIASALRSNSALRRLYIGNSNITVAGEEAFRSVLFDKSSLNAASDSNHCCEVYAGGRLNLSSYNSPAGMNMQRNRARKIYALLSLRNDTMSNVQHFSGIDLKLLPNILQAIQKYACDMYRHDPQVPLSILYEVMRRWDKVTPLYKTLGKSVGNDSHTLSSISPSSRPL